MVPVLSTSFIDPQPSPVPSVSAQFAGGRDCDCQRWRDQIRHRQPYWASKGITEKQGGTVIVAGQAGTEAAGTTMTVPVPLGPGDTNVAPERALSPGSAS